MTDIFGRYTIIDELGRGGMAIVYHARDPRFGRDVALKVLPREFLFDETFRERFAREAHTIAALEHSAIVPVHDFGEEEGQPYLVMRYMPGGSLADRIWRGPLPLAEAARILGRIGAALDAAHRRGIIHRDVKPANILFDAEGDAYLSDFGIVKLTESTAHLTGSGVIGTPAYLAPELAEQGGMTPLVDIYALGVTLYEMLSGRLPYNADTPMGLLMAHVTRPVPDVRSLRPDLPREVQQVIEQALAKNPTERFQRAGEMAAALAEAADYMEADTEADLPPADETLPAPVRTMPAPPPPELTVAAPEEPAFAPAAAAGVQPARPRRWGLVIGCGIVGALVVVAGLALGGLYLAGVFDREGGISLDEAVLPYAGDEPAGPPPATAATDMPRATAAPTDAPREPTATLDEGPALGSPGNPLLLVMITYDSDIDLLVDSIYEVSGLTVEIIPVEYRSEVYDWMCSGSAHAAYMDAYTYIPASWDGCAVSLVSDSFEGGSYYQSMIMVRADTGIESISDLPGAYYCRPSETSTVGWRIPRMMMLAEGLDPDLDLVVMDAGGYPAMFEAIINGDCDAGGAWVDARDDFAADFPNIHDQIAVIAESPPIPYDVFAVNPGIAAEAADALTEALLALDDDPDRWAAIVETWYWGDELVNLTDDAFYPLFDLWSVSGLSFYEFLD